MLPLLARTHARQQKRYRERDEGKREVAPERKRDLPGGKRRHRLVQSHEPHGAAHQADEQREHEAGGKRLQRAYARRLGARLARAGEAAGRHVSGQHVRERPHAGEHLGRQLGHLDDDLLAHGNHALELVVRALGERLAAIHDHDAAADLLHLLHVVARVDHRGALVAQAADAVEDGVSALLVNGHRGLVEEDELGLVGDAAGDVEPAGEAARELARTEPRVVAEAHELDGLVHEGAAGTRRTHDRPLLHTSRAASSRLPSSSPRASITRRSPRRPTWAREPCATTSARSSQSLG